MFDYALIIGYFKRGQSYILCPSVLKSAMIEKDSIGAKNPSQKGCFLRADAGLRPAVIEVSKYEQRQVTKGLYSLYRIVKTKTSQSNRNRNEKRFTGCYSKRCYRLVRNNHSAKGTKNTYPKVYAYSTNRSNENSFSIEKSSIKGNHTTREKTGFVRVCKFFRCGNQKTIRTIRFFSCVYSILASKDQNNNMLVSIFENIITLELGFSSLRNSVLATAQ